MENLTGMYENHGNLEPYRKLLEVKRRRGLPKEMDVWRIVIELDRQLTEKEELIAKMERLP